MRIRKRELPSGKIRWQLDYKEGECVRRARQFKTRKEAVEYETTVRDELRKGVHIADRASTSIVEAGRLWLEHCEIEGRLEAGTLRYYRQHLNDYIAPRLGAVKLPKLTRAMVEAFKSGLIKEHSHSIAARVVTSLKGILNNAMRLQLVGQNVASGVKVKIGARHEKRISIPTKAEINAILAATSKVWDERSPWRVFITVMLFTGMRPSELRGLTWDHVDLDEKLIRVRQRADYRGEMGSPKSKAGTRDIPMSPMVVNTLRRWRMVCVKESELVFQTSRGGALLSSEMWFAWDKLITSIGLPSKSYRLYDLRHAFASLMIEQGWQPKKIQTVMGHSSIQMTFDVYGHLFATPEDDAAAMEKMERSLRAT